VFCWQQVLPPVEALLDVTAHPEQDIYSMSFSFWHKLSWQLKQALPDLQQQQQQQLAVVPGSSMQPAANGLLSAGSLGQPGSMSQQPMEQQRRREFFRPAFEKLISLVRGRMR
jgi:hypothetical protein